VVERRNVRRKWSISIVIASNCIGLPGQVARLGLLDTGVQEITKAEK
jgi:hypothetical protein